MSILKFTLPSFMGMRFASDYSDEDWGHFEITASHTVLDNATHARSDRWVKELLYHH